MQQFGGRFLIYTRVFIGRGSHAHYMPPTCWWSKHFAPVTRRRALKVIFADKQVGGENFICFKAAERRKVLMLLLWVIADSIKGPNLQSAERVAAAILLSQRSTALLLALVVFYFVRSNIYDLSLPNYYLWPAANRLHTNDRLPCNTHYIEILVLGNKYIN